MIIKGDVTKIGNQDYGKVDGSRIGDYSYGREFFLLSILPYKLVISLNLSTEDVVSEGASSKAINFLA